MTAPMNTVEIPKEPAKRRAWVVYQLRIRGTSLRRLALKHDVVPSSMGQALMVPSSHLEAIIAAALGLTPAQLFPERFAANGERLHQTRAPNRTLRRSGAIVRNGKAA